MPVNVGQFLGGPEDFNLLLQQKAEGFAIGRAVQKRTWGSHRTTIPGVKIHSSAGYRAIKPINTNNVDPAEKTITGGGLYFTSLQDYQESFKLNRRFLDELKQIAEASIGGPSFETLVKAYFTDAIISAYLLNGEVNFQSIMNTDSAFLPENIRALTSPIDTAGTAKEMIQVVVKSMQDIMIRIGGSQYRNVDLNDLKVGDGKSPFKVTVPLPVANAIFTEYEIFGGVIPYNGMGNTGDVRTPDVDVLSQLFKGAEIVIPESIAVTNDAVEYEDGNPEFVFSGNFLGITYSDPDYTKPSTLIYHETAMEMEDDVNIYRDLIRTHQRGGMEVKNKNTLIRVDNILSAELFAQFSS